MCVLTSLFSGSNKGTGPGILRALKYTAEGGVFWISDNRPFLSKLGTVRGIVKGDGESPLHVQSVKNGNFSEVPIFVFQAVDRWPTA